MGGSRSERERASVSPQPVRTCVGCRGRAERRSLLRVVVRADGVVAPDPKGRTPGRGAYVHRDEVCVAAAIRRGALARALRTAPDAGAAGRLLEALRTVGAATRGATAADTHATRSTAEGR